MTHTKNSQKAFTLVEIMIVVVIIGLLASMAIPAFNKIRQQSREKIIVNNLRQIAAAGQQILLETGSTQATYGAMSPTYFPTIAPVAGESYTSLVVGESAGTLTVTLAGGTTVTFEY